MDMSKESASSSLSEPIPNKHGITKFRGKDPLGKNPQQSILNVLRLACADALRQPEFTEKLQTIKQKFYQRDFNGIFLDPENLPIYTAQYVPRRALCYSELFSIKEIQEILKSRPNIYCLGSGSGSELLGISAALCSTLDDEASIECGPAVIHSQDYTDWSEILKSLEDSVRYKWGINEDQIKYTFSIGDLLKIDRTIEQNVANAQLVTAMFVFNELFTDKVNAMGFVRMLVKNLSSGCHFLLVDSAGSFSAVQVAGKSYMSYMFFDSLKQFFKPVVMDNSRWFRHQHGLEYPLNIENMRYFVRLYQKI